MLPGPTNVPDRVMHAMMKPIINHRGPEFKPLLKGIISKVQQVLETKGDVAILSSSGTGGVEASVKNIVKSGDDVVVPVFGEFSQRLAEQIQAEGANAIKVESRTGSAPSATEVEEVARKAKKLKAIFVVYNDTSPGTTYRELQKVANVAHDLGAFIIADSISIVGGDELPQDKWGIDMVVGASQKCIGAPPGIAFVSISEQLKKYILSNVPTSTYFNLPKYLEFSSRGETPYTPALPLFYAFDEALSMVLEEGMAVRIDRHRTTARAFYESLSSQGLHPFVEERVRSNVVVTISYPQGIDDASFRGVMDEKFNVLIAGGFGPLKGKIFRIGNMGDVGKSHVINTVAAIGDALNLLGRKVDTVAMLQVAESRLKGLKEEVELGSHR